MKFLILSIWASGLAAGMAWLWSYEHKSGGVAQSFPQWPVNAVLSPQPAKYNLVLSLHPHCPCSTATVEELSAILAHTSAALHVYILEYALPSADPAWSASSSLSKSIRRLPNTTVVADLDGQEALKFGALTSGDTQLFSADGKLLFHGGITGSRGHIGANAGSAAILSAVLEGASPLKATPVYGCSF